MPVWVVPTAGIEIDWHPFDFYIITLSRPYRMAEFDCVKTYPSWLQWYKKPSYVDIKDYTLNVNEGRISRASFAQERGSASIPDRLSLKRILANQTCSPMSLHDFYMYLKYMEHSSENLEFYVWYNDYVSRYEKSPQELLKRQSKSLQENGGPLEQSSDFKTLKGTQSGCKEFTNSFLVKLDQEEQCSNLILSIGSLISLNTMCSAGSCARKDTGDNLLSRFAKSITTKFSISESVDPLDVLPTLAELEFARQTELAAVSALFLMPDSSRELNITSAMRKAILQNIAVSTSPCHFKEVAEHCYLLLQSCSHRNFIRLGVSNGTFETVCIATTMGVILTLLAFLAVILLVSVTSSGHHSRWEVLGLWPMWFVGGGLILSGFRGSCFFFLLFSRRQPLPWERYDDDSSVCSKGSAVSRTVSRTVSKINLFDRKLKVKDAGLRYLQRRIAAQSLVGGAIFATLMAIFFISLPIWNV